MKRLTPFARFLLIVLVVGGGLLGVKYAVDRGVVPKATPAPSVVPRPAILPDLPTRPSRAPEGITPAAMPPGALRIQLMAWNAQSGLILANGGATTALGSLLDKAGLRVTLARQDDTNQMQANLVTFAHALANGTAQPTDGVHFVIIMGDGAAAFFAGLNPQLKRLGVDYQAEIVGALGYSRGEDKLMGPPSWKRDPQEARGALIAGVLRDGDWNIANKWAADNSLCNNPDDQSYDPNCLNWVNADTYLDAAAKAIAPYCTDLPVVGNGQRTGGRKHICVNAVVTWTPGDVDVAQKRGGLVSIVSTAEYRSQMPAVLIGIRKWDAANAEQVTKLLSATFAAADVLNSNDQALHYAAQKSAEVYHEQTPDYWYKYFKGAVERDKQGLEVALGGSSVMNLDDNLILFGLAPGAANIYAAVYEVFGEIVRQQYPSLVPSYPAVAEVVNTRYLADLAKRSNNTPPAQMPEFTATPVERVVSRRTWRVNFESGKATFTPDARTVLDDLQRQLLVASALAVEIHGHTDNTGASSFNRTLSEARAAAVKEYLESRAPVNFPHDRVRAFGHGDTLPIAPNTTDAGRAANRRVEIVLGTTAGS